MSDPQSYAIRIHRLAAVDIDEAYERVSVLSGKLYADAWQDGLRGVFATLSMYPARCPLADEKRIFQSEVRAYPYRFGTSRTVHRVLYEVVVDEDDAPYVHILHIRHASRRPMTRAEARRIEDD